MTSEPAAHAAARDEIASFWSRASREYDARPGNGLADEVARTALRDLLAPLLPPQPSDVLDIATGTGALALIAAGLGHRVAGIDLAEGMLEVAREKASGLANPPAYASGDALAPPYAPASFDVLMNRFLTWTLHEPSRAFAAWFHLLRPGGRLIIIDAFWFAAADGTDGGWSPYTRATTATLPFLAATDVDAVARDVRAAGFVAIEIQVLPYPAADEGDGSLYTLVAQKPG